MSLGNKKGSIAFGVRNQEKTNLEITQSDSFRNSGHKSEAEDPVFERIHKLWSNLNGIILFDQLETLENMRQEKAKKLI